MVWWTVLGGMKGAPARAALRRVSMAKQPIILIINNVWKYRELSDDIFKVWDTSWGILCFFPNELTEQWHRHFVVPSTAYGSLQTPPATGTTSEFYSRSTAGNRLVISEPTTIYIAESVENCSKFRWLGRRWRKSSFRWGRLRGSRRRTWRRRSQCCPLSSLLLLWHLGKISSSWMAHWLSPASVQIPSSSLSILHGIYCHSRVFAASCGPAPLLQYCSDSSRCATPATPSPI